MANVNIRLAYKNAAWFTTNAALVLEAGRVVFLSGTITFKVGDGTTALSALGWYTPNLQAVFNAGNAVAVEAEIATPQLTINTGASNDIYGFRQKTGTKELASYMDAVAVWFGTVSAHDFLLYAANAAAALRIKVNGRVALEYGTASRMLMLNASKEIIHSTLSESDIATTAQIALKADLVGGFVPQSQLPSYVDDILEYADLASFPATGETGKIYIAIDTGKQYRWTGSAYSAVTNGFIASTDDVPASSTNKYVPAAVADNDFLVGVAATGAWLKKTLAETKTLLGLSFGAAAGTYAEGNDYRFGKEAAISASDIDWNLATHHYKTLSANTTFTFSNAAGGKTIIIAITNTASNYTVTWPAAVVWTGGTEPAQSVGAKTDIYTLTQINGIIYGSYVQDLS